MNTTRLAPLDSMRGVAILMVIVAHVAGPFAPVGSAVQAASGWGVYGVQLFFLISAWTMCHLWQSRDEPQKTARFFIRRVCRIAIPFWCGMVLYALAPTPFKVDATTFVVSATLLHALLPATISSAVPGGWSIGVEVLFYLVFPLLAMVLTTFTRCLAGAVLAYLGMVLLQAPLTALMVANGQQSVLQNYLYYSPLTQMPVFLLGMAVFHFRKEQLLQAAAVLVGWAALAFLLKQQFALNGRPAFWLIVFSLSALLWVALSTGLSTRLFQKLGQISYSAYIIHFAVIFGLRELLPWPPSVPLLLLALVSTLGVTCLLATISKNTIEKSSGHVSAFLIARLSQRGRRRLAV